MTTDRRPTRDDAIREAGAKLAAALAEADAKTARQAAEDACRSQPHLDVDHIENLIRAERGLSPIDEAERARRRTPPALALRARKPQPAVERSVPATPRRDPLDAVAGLSRKEKLALVQGIQEEKQDRS